MTSKDASTPQRTYSWSPSTASTLGGPLLICDADAFPYWSGAVHRPDYELDPTCDYARAMSAADDADAAVIRFGDHHEHTGLIWDLDGEGTAEIATADDGFLLVRSWIPLGRTQAPRRRAATAAATQEPAAGDLHIRGDHIVVVWAAAAAHETNIGPWPPTMLSAEPGTYKVTCGWHEGARGRYMPEAEIHTPSPRSVEEDWTCFWIRLVLSKAPNT
ncbi:hypothetical protein [Embleya sp. NPDC059259]|uniref:hypothetical protein n=1 Tax=unclassified Embleya TaxID=2699296 RepID=UPI00367D22D6